jgi:tetratricopeptide (TPR) repeat protein
MEGNLSIFEKMAERYNFDAVLLTTTFALTPPIVAPIYKNPDWKLVYLDPYAIIFLKDIPKNQGLIKRYAIDLSKYTVTPMELKDLGVRFIYPSPYVHLARLFDLLGADEAALQACKEALRIMPNCAEAYHLRGKVYLRKKLYQEALDNLRAAGVLMPFNLEMLTDLGCCLQELKEDKAAADIFKKITRADKKYAPAYYYLGRLELELGNNDGAIGALSRAVQYAPKEAKYHLWLAKAYLAKAKKSKGLSYFDKGRLELERATQRNIEKEEGLARGIGEALREIPEGLTRPK